MTADFNGATAVTPWKLAGAGFKRRCAAALQWGHGGDAVEMIGYARAVAKMRALQWGHGGDAVEIAH